MASRTRGLGGRVIAAGAIAALATALVGCSTEAEEPTDDATADLTSEEIIENAKGEGEVVVYTAFPDAIQEQLNTAFADAYGIEVRSERLIQSAFSQRVQAEFDANQQVVDVIIGSDMAAFDVWESQDRLVSLPDVMPAVEAWPADYRSDVAAIVQTNFYGIIYNTDLVSEEDAPETWEDLLDPQFTGNTLLLDPAAGTASQYQYDVLLEELGEEYLEALGKQGSFVDSGVPASQNVGAGAAAIYAPVIPPIVDIVASAGLPVAAVFPEPTAGGNAAAAIPLEVPNPNAARVFLDFILSAEGQAIINAGGYSALDGLDGVETIPDYVVAADHERTVANAETIIRLLKG